MTEKAQEYRNGWSASLTKNGPYYVAMVRNGRGDLHDKMMCDTYRSAAEYYRAFKSIARNA